MTLRPFDFAPLLRPGLPAPAAKWTGYAKYNFIGGDNDPDHVPVEGLVAAVTLLFAWRSARHANYLQERLDSTNNRYFTVANQLRAHLQICFPDAS